MKFTVFGASGFIGAYLVDHLRSLGHEVDAVTRSTFFDQRGSLGHCIYAIGLTADFRTRPFDTIEAHVSVASNLLRDSDFDSFLYLSSTRVYANSSEAAEETLLSARPSNPSDLYNLSKLTGESICLSSGRRNVRIARLSNVIGPDEAESDTFVGELCREAKRGHIQLRSDPASTKDYIWIGDVADLLTRIAIGGKQTIYNVASGIDLAHQDWVSGIAAITGCSVAVDANAPVIGFPPIATGRIVEEFGFVPSSPLDFLPTILDRQAA
jgi:nucleoside-diphosphate-sugar epimerase